MFDHVAKKISIESPPPDTGTPEVREQVSEETLPSLFSVHNRSKRAQLERITSGNKISMTFRVVEGQFGKFQLTQHRKQLSTLLVRWRKLLKLRHVRRAL